MPITEWNPGTDYAADEPELLPIAGPPCADCARWRPMKQWEWVLSTNVPTVHYRGVILCHGPQRRDFSCFKSKVEVVEPV